jgi:hypothetical protein
MGYSNEGIPSNLPEMLENAESFEVYFQDTKRHKEKFDFSSEYLKFQANQVNKNPSGESRKGLISVFLKDVEKGGEPSRCWIPHHGIRAIYKNQLIEIAICFMCSWFRGEMLGERFYGTLPNEEESESKIFFDKIITEIDYES